MFKSNAGSVAGILMFVSLLALLPSIQLAFANHASAPSVRTVAMVGPNHISGAGLLNHSNVIKAIPLPSNASTADPAPDYNEQLGETFTQSFTSMDYNITAVAQVDSDGYGPAYVLNGLSDTGYWYQVGLSYDWKPAKGFRLDYEVFDSSGNSIFPANGGGGLLAFSGPVNAGDTVLVNLYFGSSGQVVMYGYDWNTGASASETYSAEGASYFVGSNDGSYTNANTNGFFTGLMTEQYHVSPYYGNEQFVSYTDKEVALSSAYLWIEERNVATKQKLFGDCTPGPISFANYYQIQEFQSNGATEYANAYSFYTGAANISVSLATPTPAADAGIALVIALVAVVVIVIVTALIVRRRRGPKPESNLLSTTDQ